MTSAQRWGRGLTIETAMSAAGLTSSKPKNVDYYLLAAVLNEPTDDELENMRQCVVADKITGSPMYYTTNRTPEDSEMIDRLHIGWLVITKYERIK